MLFRSIADDEWGQGIQEALRKEGVCTDAAIIVEGETSSFSVILVDAESGKRTVLYSPNVNAHMHDSIFPKDLIRKSRWLFLNHLTDVSCVILDDILELLTRHPEPFGSSASRTRSRQARVEGSFAWNPGGSQVREGYDAPVVKDLLAQADILFLNAEEAMLFTQTESIEDALRIGTGAGAKLMCVTDGAHGACLSDGEMVYLCPAVPDIKVIDTTGAGDAFAVGVTWAIHMQKDLPTALRAGMINAASVLTEVGTQKGLLTNTALNERLSTTTLSVTTSSL